MSNEIIRISNIAKQYQKVDTVMYALNLENLKASAKRLEGNKAVGIDKMTKREYLENLDENINELINKMKKMSYRPKAVKRVYIPKIGSDKKRPLGIPAFEDKIVQDGMTQILNAIYEPMFKEFSFGFRPNKSCHQAIAYLDMMLHRHKTNYIVDLDIKGFFDNINHEWLIKRMHYKVSETIKLINIKLLGHYRYYGITDNTKGIRNFYEIISNMLYKVLNRRTQKNKYSYEKYYEKIQKNIMRPKIYVNIVKMTLLM